MAYMVSAWNTESNFPSGSLNRSPSPKTPAPAGADSMV